MKKYSVNVTQTVSDITCDICGQSVVNKYLMSQMTNLDNFVEYARLNADFGYGSKKDGEKLQFDFCEACFDDLLVQIKELKKFKKS